MASFSPSDSHLIRLLLERVPEGKGDPSVAMGLLVSGLRKQIRKKDGAICVEAFFRFRNVVDLQYRRELDCDGFVEPLGKEFRDGFRIVVNRSISATRASFTIAHELCHTFFYELVPEIKFSPHPTNEAEERLCNVGAADLLMPRKAVLRSAKPLPVCLKSLETLANKFSVSQPAMLLQLRALDIWKAELSSWTKLTNGSFAMESLVGGKYRDCNWIDRSPLRLAWETGKASAGHACIECVDKTGRRGVLPVRYDLERRANRVIVLWGTGVVRSNVREPSLFSCRAISNVA